MNFQILLDDEDFIAINKPPSILVHRTSISEDKIFVLQLLRDQIGQKVYPVHRLDRATSGVLIFGKSSEAAEQLAVQFREQRIEKNYLAVVRGYLESSAIIDYPLAPEPGKEKQPAVTHYQSLAQVEMDWSVGKYPKSRYSLVKVQPRTGRRHQIRRHFSHLRHPIIGDKPHGDVKHNKYFEQVLGIKGMMLHAQQLRFFHPLSQKTIAVEAELNAIFLKTMDLLGFPLH